jgi:hypothetical protein
MTVVRKKLAMMTRLRDLNARLFTVFVLALVLGAPEARSTDWGPAPAPAMSSAPDSEWQFQFTPGAWAVNLVGDVTVEGLSTSLNLNTVQLLEVVDWNVFGITGAEKWIYLASGHFEARNGPVSFFTLSDYFKLRAGGDFGGTARPIPQLAISIDANVKIDLQLILAEFGGTYEIFKQWNNTQPSLKNGYSSPGGFTALDLVAGGRYNSLDIEADVRLAIGATLTPNIIPVSITRTGQIVGRIEADEEWVDPFIGLRLRKDFGNGYEFFARGDVGGFSLKSDFVWQAIAGLSGQCKCNENLSWTLAYRWLDTDYKTGLGRENFEFDVLLHGPTIGSTYRF